MKQPALVIIKPDGVSKNLVGNILNKFALTKLEIIAVKISRVTREMAAEHYKNIKNQPFFSGVVDYLAGKFHNDSKIWIIIYYGDNAIKKCREIAGATNPEEALPTTIRGAYGRITTKGIYENVVHVSSDSAEAKREIMLWFDPDEIDRPLFKTTLKNVKSRKERCWA